MLFGRRRPGFTKIQVPENQEDQVSEELVKVEEKPELMEYLASLPDVNDEFADIVKEMEGVEEDMPELNEAQKLADYIRLRSAAANLTSYVSLKEEIDNVDALLEEMKQDESCQDIICTKGNKDNYYYSNLNMSNNYAMIATLVEDKDLVATIAKMVRFNCKTYPSPTPVSYFEKHPYYATKVQIERAISLFANMEEYKDIKQFANNKNVNYLFSEEYMSLKYANALATEELYAD